MLDDRAVRNPPDVDEVPRHGVPGRGLVGEQRHRRTYMAPVHREVHDDEVILSDDAMDRRRRVVEVVVERCEGLS
jgi:hypothetical protein